MTYLQDAPQARAAEFISLRRDIHRQPEPAFEGHRTAALVSDKPGGWGYAVTRGLDGTGMVGTPVRGESHEPGSKRLGIRADMDAAPIVEATGLPPHQPGYDFNDDNITVGSAYWVLLAERFLTHKEPAGPR